MESGLLYNPTKKQTNLRVGCKSALQPGTMTGRRSEKFRKTSDIFSLPRISTKNFPYFKGKIDWSIGINYSSVNFKWTQVFLCCQSFDRRGQWIFLKIQVILDKSKATRVAMIWRRVKVNRTRLCTAAHFARNEIKYQRSRESGLFQYKLYACTKACLSIIPFCKQQFYKCYPLSLHRNRRKAKHYHGQYLWQKGNLVKLIVNRQEIFKADQDRTLWGYT